MFAQWFFYLLLVMPFLYMWIQKVYSRFKRFPPGPTRWPIIGSIPQMMAIDTVYPYRQIDGLSKKYGPIMSVGCGVYFSVFVSSFELMKDIFKRTDTNSGRFQYQFTKQRNEGDNFGILWGHGDIWKEVRRYTVKMLRDFGFGKVRSMEETYKEEVDIFIKDIREEIEQNGGIWKVELHRLAIIAINILWSSVGGYRFDENSDEIKENIKISADLFEMLRPNNLLSTFPFLKIFPEWSGYRSNGVMHKRSREFIQTLVNDAKMKRGNRVMPESFLEMFLDDIEKNKGNPNSNISEKQLVTILMDLFIAGTDTTGTVLNWLILHLARNPTAQQKARDEIKLATENWTKSISVADVSRLPYLKACIYEAMRHSPFMSIPTARHATEDIEVNGYIIPKGSSVMYNLYAVFHDKELWGEDVEEYFPDRYFKTDGTIDRTKLERIAQFGFGTRICPGETLAMDTLAATCMGILSNFNIGLVEGREARLEESNPSLSISPKPYVVKVETISH